MSEDEIAKNPPVDPLRDIEECFAIHAHLVTLIESYERAAGWSL